MTNIYPEQAMIQNPEASECIQFSPTSKFRILYGGGEGLPDFFEEQSECGASAPLHSHPWPSWELVIEGQLRVVVDGQNFQANAGDMIYIPPHVPHSYIVESETARTVGINLSDGRFPNLQRQVAPMMAAPEGPDFQKIGALAKSHGVDVLGPPLHL